MTAMGRQAGLVIDAAHQPFEHAVRITCRSGDGAQAVFAVPQADAVLWEVGDAVFMDAATQTVYSTKLAAGTAAKVTTGSWTSPPASKFAAARHCTFPGEVLRGRVVAVQSTGTYRWRVMCRYACASGGCYECEFPMGTWEPLPGLRVIAGLAPVEDLTEYQGVAGRAAVTLRLPTGNPAFEVPVVWFSDVGPYKTWTVGVDLWARGDYPMGSPMLDDSVCPPETLAWLRAHGGDVEHRDHQDGRYWTLRHATSRGAAEHIKFPRETWREACEAVGLPWPGETGRFDDDGPLYTGTDDPWPLPRAVENTLERALTRLALQGRTPERFGLPHGQGYAGAYRGIEVAIDASLPEDWLAATYIAPSGERRTILVQIA